jgi:hypothetical protein
MVTSSFASGIPSHFTDKITGTETSPAPELTWRDGNFLRVTGREGNGQRDREIAIARDKRRDVSSAAASEILVTGKLKLQRLRRGMELFGQTAILLIPIPKKHLEANLCHFGIDCAFLNFSGADGSNASRAGESQGQSRKGQRWGLRLVQTGNCKIALAILPVTGRLSNLGQIVRAQPNPVISQLE